MQPCLIAWFPCGAVFWKQEVSQLCVSFFKSEMQIVHLKTTRTDFIDIICIFAVSEVVAEGMKHKTTTVQLSRDTRGESAAIK